MDKLIEEYINEVVEPMYEVVLDNKASFEANDVYQLQKLLETYANTLADIKTNDQGMRDEIIMESTKAIVEKINKMNDELIRHAFILDADRDNLIAFFNNTATEYGLSYTDEDITKQYRKW